MLVFLSGGVREMQKGSSGIDLSLRFARPGEEMRWYLPTNENVG